ncbi:MAG: nitrilase-related carbon-nitrogen hydrolase [Planctomycetota bacterium]
MDCRVALCQMRPKLGVLDQNLAAHHAWLDRCLEQEVRIAVFPELSLTGYFLRDLTQDVAMSLEDPRVMELVARSKDCSFVFGLVEESRDHRFYNTAVFAEDGVIKHVHRKVHLPDYGIFEEGRYFASGEGFTAFDSKYGRFGLLICEDAWHLSAAWLHFLQGVDALLIPVASPARGIDTEEAELSSHGSWRTLSSALSLFFQTWVLRCNRVGFEDGTLFWGGSSFLNPFGKQVAEAHAEEEDLLVHTIDSQSLKRARMATPLLRDARPELVRIHLARLLEDPDALQVQRQESSPKD